MINVLYNVIMDSKDFVLVSGEYGQYPCYCDHFYCKEGEDCSKYTHWGTCQIIGGYHIEDKYDQDPEDSKEHMLEKFKELEPYWIHNISLSVYPAYIDETINIYDIKMKAHDERGEGWDIRLGYINKEDLEKYVLKYKERDY